MSAAKGHFAKDYFSGAARDYAAHRPRYPEELFTFLAAQAPALDSAWDCATGNGQAALGLAAHFRHVTATDASPEQIARALPHPRVAYRVAPAEASGLPEAGVDLVAVAQAAHWFDLPRFYAEVRRVLRPGGLLALWGYERLSVAPDIDAVIEDFYGNALGPYWPPERRHVEAGYRDLPFPFADLAAPAFSLTARWDLDALMGYFATWSAVQRCRETTGQDPLPGVRGRLLERWGSPDTAKTIKWPLFLRLGRR